MHCSKHFSLADLGMLSSWRAVYQNPLKKVKVGWSAYQQSGRKFCKQVDSDTQRVMPKTLGQYKWNTAQELKQPQSPFSLSVAVVGAPNHGKSTLTNALVNWRVCSVSSKVHTTQENQIAVMTDGNIQVSFYDTPGIIGQNKARMANLNSSMVTAPSAAASKVDLLIVLVDASNRLSMEKMPSDVIGLLEEYKNKHAILVLNKVDQVRNKHKLLLMIRLLTDGMLDSTVSCDNVVPDELQSMDEVQQKYDIRKYESALTDEDGMPLFMSLVDDSIKPPRHIPKRRGWPAFKRVFLVSALTGDGVSDLRSYLMEQATQRAWSHHGALVTDHSPWKMALMVVREKFLDQFAHRVGYTLDFRIDYWQYTAAGVLEVFVSAAPADRDGYVPVLVGKNGMNVRRVAQAAQQDMRNLFHCDVTLKVQIVDRSDLRIDQLRKSFTKQNCNTTHKYLLGSISQRKVNDWLKELKE